MIFLLYFCVLSVSISDHVLPLNVRTLESRRGLGSRARARARSWRTRTRPRADPSAPWRRPEAPPHGIGTTGRGAEPQPSPGLVSALGAGLAAPGGRPGAHRRSGQASQGAGAGGSWGPRVGGDGARAGTTPQTFSECSARGGGAGMGICCLHPWSFAFPLLPGRPGGACLALGAEQWVVGTSERARVCGCRVPLFLARASQGVSPVRAPRVASCAWDEAVRSLG